MTLARRMMARVRNDGSKLVQSLFSHLYILPNNFSTTAPHDSKSELIQNMYQVLWSGKLEGRPVYINRQNKIFMQIRSVSPRHFPREQEYDFRVKVNYDNGAISVHGPSIYPQAPTPHIHMPQYPPVYTQPISNPHPVPFSRQTMPTYQSYLPCSPSYSISTASHTQFPENTAIKHFKCQSETLTEAFSSTQRHMSSQPLLYSEVQREKKIMDPRQQQQIDCVICEKKFKTQDFDYHLELHRSSRRKTEQIPIHNQSLHEKNQKQIMNSSQQQIKPELLYSFHQQNSLQGSHQGQSIRSQKSLNIQYSVPLILNTSGSSSAYENKSKNRSMVNQNNGEQIQPGIRYLPPETARVSILNNSLMSLTSKLSSNQQAGPITTANAYESNHSQPMSSVRSSQVFAPPINNSEPRSSHSSNKILKDSVGHISPRQMISNPSQPSQRSINPFELIEQEQSKIYEYFPSSGHYSLSQHRVIGDQAPIKNVSEQFPEIEKNNAESLHAQSFRNSNQSRLTKDRAKNEFRKKEEEEEVCSRLSHSSISSIRSETQPLEDMSKQKIIRTYHNPRSKIDLSNIIGMSEVLAREGLTHHSNSIKQQQSKYNPHRSSNQFKVITAKSVILSPQSEPQHLSHTTTINDPRNAEVHAIHNRQIYRGTQVDEDDLCGLDQMNSSKSSTKTKLPRNYLAVNDFIMSGSTQRRPH